MLHGLRICQVFDTPRPQAAYNCRSVSITTLTAHSPPTDTIHLSVAAWSECETAIKDISGCLLDRWASWRKVFSATFEVHISYGDSRKLPDDVERLTRTTAVAEESDYHRLAISARELQFWQWGRIGAYARYRSSLDWRRWFPGCELLLKRHRCDNGQKDGAVVNWI